MANFKLKVKRGAGVPANGALDQGELGFNTTHVNGTGLSDGKLFVGANTLSGKPVGIAMDGHLHSIDDISGVVSIAKGGTGATTASGARTNLGANLVGANLFTLNDPDAIRFIRINADNTVTALSDSEFRTAIGAQVAGAYLTGNETITLSGDVTGSGTTTITTTIGNDSVSNAKLANMAVNTIKGRATTGTGDPEDLTAAQVRTILNVANGATANTGTVTSVATAGTVSGLTLTGGPITTSGTITLGGTLVVEASNFGSQTAKTFLAAPNAANGTPTFRLIAASDVPTLNQDTTGTAGNVTGIVAIANGGTGASTAAGARTNLGASTVGGNLFTLTNPNDIAFIRLNANNTVSSLGAADFRTAIGAQVAGSYLTAEADTLATVTGRGATTGTAISITNNTASTTSSTGALLVTGGVGIGGALNVGGAVVIGGNLTVNGTTTTINSTQKTIDDPVLTLGGDTAPTVTDSLDRGVEFRYFDTAAKLGFFGYDRSTGFFTFIPDSVNTAEVHSGTKGTIDITTLTNSTGALTISTGASNGRIDLTPNGTGTVRLTKLNTAGFVKTNASGDLSVDTSTYVTQAGIDWNVAANYAFKTIAVSGQTSVAADSNEDTLTLVAGTGVTITTDATTDTITVTNSDRGSAQNIFKNFVVAGQGTVVADSNDDSLTLVAGTNVQITTNATTDTITIASAHGLGAHSDVIITSPDANDLLVYNGTNWVNVEELDCGAFAV
jgi:hypothetical protein